MFAPVLIHETIEENKARLIAAGRWEAHLAEKALRKAEEARAAYAAREGERCEDCDLLSSDIASEYSHLDTAR